MSKVAIGLGVVGIVLAIVALVGPWWTMTASVLVVTVSLNFGLFGASGTMPGGGAVGGSYSTLPHVGSVFMAGAALTALGLILGVVMLLLIAMSGKKPGLRKIGAAMGIVGAIVLLVGPLYVMSALPGALSSDVFPSSSGISISGFFGGISAAGMSLTWGGGWGWYLAFVAAILLLIGGILALRAPKAAAMPAAPMAAPPPPQ